MYPLLTFIVSVLIIASDCHGVEDFYLRPRQQKGNDFFNRSNRGDDLDKIVSKFGMAYLNQVRDLMEAEIDTALDKDVYYNTSMAQGDMTMRVQELSDVELLYAGFTRETPGGKIFKIKYVMPVLTFTYSFYVYMKDLGEISGIFTTVLLNQSVEIRVIEDKTQPWGVSMCTSFFTFNFTIEPYTTFEILETTITDITTYEYGMLALNSLIQDALKLFHAELMNNMDKMGNKDFDKRHAKRDANPCTVT